jgi:hypothetical protein
MKKVQVTIGTIWQDRGTEKKFEVTGINQETGVIQISAVGNGNGDGYKTMTEKSLRNNYKLIARTVKEVEKPPVVAAEAVTIPETTKESSPPPEPPQEQPAVKAGRAAGGWVQLKDGVVIAGSRFIVGVCGKYREDTYKADSPIRWLLKEAGQALLKEYEAQIVYGEKITK